MMMKLEIDKEKIVVFTGAGVSQESGLPCFAGFDGLWGKHKIEDVCTRAGFETDPAGVTRFYNELKAQTVSAKPNAAHMALAELGKHYDVTIVTTNVDNLHEAAGSKKVIHVHGDLSYGKSHLNQESKVHLGDRSIEVGEMLDGVQMRHDVVFYGEFPENLELAKTEIKQASKFLVVGSSLSVAPSNSLIKHARFKAEKAIVNLEPMRAPYGFRVYGGAATEAVPSLVKRWIEEKHNS